MQNKLFHEVGTLISKQISVLPVFMITIGNFLVDVALWVHVECFLAAQGHNGFLLINFFFFIIEVFKFPFVN